MHRLFGFRYLWENSLRCQSFNLIRVNTPSLCTQSIKRFHEDASKYSDEWMETLNTLQQERISFIRNELTLYSLQNHKVPRPEWISTNEYIDMLGMTTSRRRAYYGYLNTKYWAMMNRKDKNIVRQALLNEMIEDKARNVFTQVEKYSRPDHIPYGLGKNALFKRFSSRQSAKWKNRNLIRAYYQNQPPLIFDLEFAYTMKEMEIESAIREITYSYSILRQNQSPFVMHLCNLEEDTYFWNRLQKGFKGFEKLPIVVSSKDVTELYSSGTKNLIYLTPDSEHILDEVDPNCGYIIGAIVDKGDKKPYTLAKAKKLNIKTAQFPIGGFVKFHAQKALAFNHVTQILLEAKRSNNWKKAFQHIPRRKML